MRDNDPELANNLSGGAGRCARHPVAAGSAVAAALAVAVCLGLLVAGPPAAIAAALTVCAVTAGLLLQHRLGENPADPDDGRADDHEESR